MGNKIDITGSWFGNLKVLEISGYDEKSHSSIWKCECLCGNICYYDTIQLKHRATIISCGKCGVIKATHSKHIKPKLKILIHQNLWFDKCKRYDKPENDYITSKKRKQCCFCNSINHCRQFKMIQEYYTVDRTERDYWGCEYNMPYINKVLKNKIGEIK